MAQSPANRSMGALDWATLIALSLLPSCAIIGPGERGVKRTLGDLDDVVQDALIASLRWLGTALATAGILWYMAGRPEGLAGGFTLSLVAFVCAALRSADDLSHEPPAERRPGADARD